MSVLNQSGEEQVECPLCMEPLEVDDLNFYPCTCLYQICRFCWHRIRTDENGLCPACRKAYPEDPADFKPLTQEEVAKMKAEKRQKDHQRKQKITENRKHLANVRVVQRNLVFIVGLPMRLADAEVLKKHEYFGKYGKIHKVVINQSTAYAGTQGPSASAYVTYQRSDDALRAIQSINNIVVDTRVIKTSLGTTKYCSHFMKNQPCPKTDCMYLHELGDPEASFTKEEMQQGKHQEFEKKLHEQLIRETAANNNNSNITNNNRKNNTSPSPPIIITSSSSDINSDESSSKSSSISLSSDQEINILQQNKETWPSLSSQELSQPQSNATSPTPSTMSSSDGDKIHNVNTDSDHEIVDVKNTANNNNNIMFNNNVHNSKENLISNGLEKRVISTTCSTTNTSTINTNTTNENTISNSNINDISNNHNGNSNHNVITNQNGISNHTNQQHSDEVNHIIGMASQLLNGNNRKQNNNDHLDVNQHYTNGFTSRDSNTHFGNGTTLQTNTNILSNNNVTSAANNVSSTNHLTTGTNNMLSNQQQQHIHNNIFSENSSFFSNTIALNSNNNNNSNTMLPPSLPSQQNNSNSFNNSSKYSSLHNNAVDLPSLLLPPTQSSTNNTSNTDWSILTNGLSHLPDILPPVNHSNEDWQAAFGFRTPQQQIPQPSQQQQTSQAHSSIPYLLQQLQQQQQQLQHQQQIQQQQQQQPLILANHLNSLNSSTTSNNSYSPSHSSSNNLTHQQQNNLHLQQSHHHMQQQQQQMRSNHISHHHDDDLGFDPFHETQKALGELIENEKLSRLTYQQHQHNLLQQQQQQQQQQQERERLAQAHAQAQAAASLHQNNFFSTNDIFADPSSQFNNKLNSSVYNNALSNCTKLLDNFVLGSSSQNQNLSNPHTRSRFAPPPGFSQQSVPVPPQQQQQHSNNNNSSFLRNSFTPKLLDNGFNMDVGSKLLPFVHQTSSSVNFQHSLNPPAQAWDWSALDPAIMGTGHLTNDLFSTPPPPGFTLRQTLDNF